MTYDQRAYWIWLQHALGAGSQKPHRILTDFQNAQAFYEAGELERRLLGIFTQKELSLLSDYTLEEATAVLEYCEKVGLQVITPQSDDYPVCLKNIHNPPCVLYVKGSLPQVDSQPSIAVVGTRNATNAGIKIAFEFGYQLAKAGAVVVSGGALGIDTAAHKGALQAGGKTVCVLGCGIEYRYLMDNASLRAAIAQSGAVVSEYSFNTPPSKMSFPIRNRIISGLSAGTLVVEAAGKSGSLITANLALEQGRDVFAVPCGLDNPVSQGVNNLIKIGAKPVSNADEILEEYEYRFPGKVFLHQFSAYVPVPEIQIQESKPVNEHIENKPIQPLNSRDFSEQAIALYEKLSEEPRHISELEQLTGLSAPQMLTAITELELAGKISSQSGRRYCLSK